VSGAQNDLGLWELVEQRAAATPDLVIGIDEDERELTPSSLRDDALRVAAGLYDLGVTKDVPVSWMLPTWLESAVLVAALARLGAIQNPMLPILGSREMEFIAGQTGASALIVPSEWRGRDYTAQAEGIAATHDGLRVITADRALPEGEPSDLPPPPGATTATGAPVRWVFYTSGTTADPKGVRHTDQTVKASAVGMIEALEIVESDRSALVFPFTHIGGIAWLFTMLITGCRAVFVEAFAPATTIPVLQREKITLAGAGTAFHLAYLAAQRDQPGTPLFPEVRVFPGGAAPKPPQLHYEMQAELGGVGIVSGYGLTEAPILTMNRVTDSDDQLAETEGGPTPGVELRIVRADSSTAAPGEEGEIRAKGPQIFLGYVDGSLDADAFDDEGWFRTGDLGTIGADEHVRITGRLKDVIIRKGETIAAKELEDLLFTHPKVADVAVIGLPDARSGERACAVVVATDLGAPTLAELAAFLRDLGLTVQKIPEQLEIEDELPRNPSGKVLKHELRAKYSD
jgi:cyclohexanecarboxylate-CoA ligase